MELLDGGQANEITQNLLDEVETLKSCQDRTKDEKLLATLHSMGIDLWNIIVGKKAGKKIELVVCARGNFLISPSANDSLLIIHFLRFFTSG